MIKPNIYKSKSGVTGNSGKPEIGPVENDVAKPKLNDIAGLAIEPETVLIKIAEAEQEMPKFVNLAAPISETFGSKLELSPVGEFTIQVVVEKSPNKGVLESPKARTARIRSLAAAAKLEAFTYSMESVATTTLDMERMKSRALVCEALRNFIILYTTLGVICLIYFLTTHLQL